MVRVRQSQVVVVQFGAFMVPALLKPTLVTGSMAAADPSQGIRSPAVPPVCPGRYTSPPSWVVAMPLAST